MPSRLNSRQKELLGEFARETSGDEYEETKKFMEKARRLEKK